MERAVAGLEKVHQHVHGAGVLAGDLGARHQLDARFGCLFAGGRDAVLTVMVGQGKGGQAGLDGQVHELFGRVAPVGDGRVGVQVDHSATVVCPLSWAYQRHPAGGRAARGRMDRVSGPVEHTSPREACGVFGIFAPGRNVAPIVFDGLYALQHRGQESAGMAVSDGTTLMVIKDMGLVTQVFNDYKLAGLVGHLAIGHTRYSTTGSSSWHNAQPMYRQAGGTEFAIGHNGNLTNTEELAASMGMLPGMATSDSDLIAELVARELDRRRRSATATRQKRSTPGPAPWPGRPAQVCSGAFSLVLADRSQPGGGAGPERLPAPVPGQARRRLGPRLGDPGAGHHRCPLRPRSGTGRGAGDQRRRVPEPPAVAARAHRSPSCACSSSSTWPVPTAVCMARNCTAPGSAWASYWPSRRPVAADMVVGVPDSGMPAAEGYSRRSGIPYGHGLVKNRYIGRTFINPDPGQRALGVRRKLNPLKDAIAGKRLIVVDDSIVRGTTTRAMVRHAARGGRPRSPPPHLLAALSLALLLRPGHRARGPN